MLVKGGPGNRDTATVTPIAIGFTQSQTMQIIEYGFNPVDFNYLKQL